MGRIIPSFISTSLRSSPSDHSAALLLVDELALVLGTNVEPPAMPRNAASGIVRVIFHQFANRNLLKLDFHGALPIADRICRPAKAVRNSPCRLPVANADPRKERQKLEAVTPLLPPFFNCNNKAYANRAPRLLRPGKAPILFHRSHSCISRRQPREERQARHPTSLDRP